MAQTKHSQHFTFVSIYVKSKFINYHIYKVTATEPKVEEKFTSTQFIQRTANRVNFKIAVKFFLGIPKQRQSVKIVSEKCSVCIFE